MVEREAKLEQQAALDDAAGELGIARVATDRAEQDHVVLSDRVEVVVGEDVAGREVVARAERELGDVELDTGCRGTKHLERLGGHLRTDSVACDHGEFHGAGHGL